jgi:hypothetical protein
MIGAMEKRMILVRRATILYPYDFIS